jgi:hypothetical protein
MKYLAALPLTVACLLLSDVAGASAPPTCGNPDSRSLGLYIRAVTAPQYADMRRQLGVAQVHIDSTHRLADEGSRGKCVRITRLLAAWPHMNRDTDLRFYEVDGFYFVTAINDNSKTGGVGYTTRVAVLDHNHVIGVMSVR